MTKNTNKKERLSVKNPAWFNERMDAFDLYWENKIDQATFKQKISEIDMKYKNPDGYAKQRIEELKAQFSDIIEEYEQLKKEAKR